MSILNTKVINHDDLCVGGEGKSMLGVNAHIWRKLITCKTLKTSHHGIVPWIAFTFDSNWHVLLFSPSAGISLISFRNISKVYSEKTPSKCTISRQVVLQRPFQNRTINVSVCVYACHILKQKIVGEGGRGVNICFHISTKGWTIWCLNRLRLNWNATNIYSNVNRKIISCSAPCNVCLSWGAVNVQQRTVFWGNDSIRSECISNRFSCFFSYCCCL